MSSQSHDVVEEAPPETTQRHGQSTGGTDTGRWRRVAAGVVGAVLVLAGVRRRSLRGALTAVAGGWLVYRGLGKPDVRSRMGGASGGTGERSETGAPPEAVDVERSITVEESADELYDRWRDPETHERMWAHFADVSQTGEDRQHWAVGGPMDVTLEWDAAVVSDEPGEFLHWESLPGATVPNEGTVRFESRPGSEDGQETEVTLHLRFDPPGGTLGTAAAKRLDLVPETAAGTALGRFKSLVETGEIPTLEGNPSARGSGDLL